MLQNYVGNANINNKKEETSKISSLEILFTLKRSQVKKKKSKL